MGGDSFVKETVHDIVFSWRYSLSLPSNLADIVNLNCVSAEVEVGRGERGEKTIVAIEE